MFKDRRNFCAEQIGRTLHVKRNHTVGVVCHDLCEKRFKTGSQLIYFKDVHHSNGGSLLWRNHWSGIRRRGHDQVLLLRLGVLVDVLLAGPRNDGCL
ncbi:hypothetical protein [Cryobacterium sp. Y50]|uniref:hypothetical protein n=1 Tax=Cryobacterium sp. Y50 TaxID=2048286 RepID=UPI0011B0156B|nr:hypothetical protein [Cryobacterium sp. Y50]